MKNNIFFFKIEIDFLLIYEYLTTLYLSQAISRRMTE